MKIKFPIAVILLQLFVNSVLSQNNELKFNLVKGTNGKPLGKINAITQDPHGYMWFCGQGDNCIYRYDGNRMISFSHDSLNSNSLGLTILEKIYADDSGMIWIAGDGLDKYNPSTGIFKHYRHDKNNPGSLIDNGITAILKDHRGRLWIGTGEGLDCLDEKTGKFIHYRNDPGNPKSLSNNVVNTIYEDHKGVIWIGTGWRWFGWRMGEGGLNRLEPDGTFTSYLHDPKNEHSLINNKVNAIFEDSRGTFWIGTSEDGLHTMNRETGSFERHTYNPAKPDGLSKPPIPPGAMNEPVTFIHEDVAGDIWIGTRSFGINRYDTGTKKITNYRSGNGFPDNGGWCAYTSREGVLWISTEESNLFYADPLIKTIDNIAVGTSANSFLESKDGSIWVGTDGGGLRQYDSKINLINHFRYDPFNAQSLVPSTINTLFQNEQDTIWLGALAGGIEILNTKTKQISRFRYDGTLKDSVTNPVYKIFRDKEGYMWFARPGGLTRYNPKDRTVKIFEPDVNDSFSISTARINYAIEASDGDIWAGGFGDNGDRNINQAGLNRLNKQSGRFKHYLQGVTIDYIYEDSEKSIWAITPKRLYRLKKGEDNFLPFFDTRSEENILKINALIEDDYKNIWLSSKSSIIKLNLERDKMYTYESKFGIAPNSPGWAIYKCRDGRILIGNSKGFYVFLPGDLNIETQSFKINITDLFINNRPVTQEKESPLHKPIEEIGELVLKYNQNNFGFNFAGVDYKSPEDNKYFTKLEGYDNEWRQAGAEKSAYYFYVRPGTYTFRVKGINSDGTEGEKAITITVLPPWWKTWWAYCVYGLLLLSAIFAIYRYQKQRIIHLERQKRQQFELAQAKEIEKAYTELKSTQALLIQSEKMASLGELTAGIAHEIQNPLNFVNNFSEVNKELIDELRVEQKKETRNLENENDILNNIEDNLEKINHHGKRADAIVKGMLLHSRSSTGHKEPANINALADEYLRLSYHGLRAKDKTFNVTLKTDFDKSVGDINIIPQDIGRVLLNLYNNAFYAATLPLPIDRVPLDPTDKHDPTIWVSTKKVDDKVLISVRDNGPGIPQKIVDKIFQPFFTTKPTGQGTGLGLSLSYDIVKAHGGDIKVQTAENTGSEFIVTLPL